MTRSTTESSQFGGSRSHVQGSKSKRARCAFQGVCVSEDRFLQVQEEVYRLRREATAKEEIYKLLIARLSRAENAAKRKMCIDFQQALKPCKQKAAVIAAHASHRFYADQKAQDLEDKLRGKQREIDKLEVYIKQYQIDIQSMKARMDIMARYTWRVKPFANPHDTTSRREDTDLCEQVEKLQEENLNLQFQISSLAQPQSTSRDNPQCQIMQTKVDPNCDLPTTNLGGNIQNGDCVLKQSLESAQGDSAQYVTMQMLTTWQQLESLRKRYDGSAEELQKIKVSHEKTLCKLQDVYRELNEVLFLSSFSVDRFSKPFARRVTCLTPKGPSLEMERSQGKFAHFRIGDCAWSVTNTC